MTDNIDAVLDRNEKTQEAQCEPESTNALALLRSIYRNQQQPLGTRIRCAVEALPYENPKLSALAVASMPAHDFAAALERAILRSRNSVPALAAPIEQYPASEMKAPFVMRRRNLR